MIQHTICPVCNSNNISKNISAKDYTVSHKIFDIWLCSNCTLQFTQNIPTQENIGEFYKSENYISHSETKKGLINNLYHKIRKRTLLQKRNLINKVTGLNQGKIVDIGCGTGAFLHTMQQAGWNVTGLEPDSTARQKAKEIYQINPLPSDSLMQLQPNTYHAITMWHVLEHVHQLQNYIQQIAQLLLKNGKFIVAVPNYTSYDATHYKTFWAAYDVPRHLYHFSPKSIDELMTKNNLKVTAILPMWYDSFYVSMLSEQYKNKGKNNYIKALFVGLISNFKTLFNHKNCSSLIYIIEKK